MRSRGFSLAEAILGSTLTLLLGMVMLWALIPVLHYSTWGYGRAEVVQASARIAARLEADLRTAPWEGLTLPNDSEKGLLGIHGIVGVTDTGLAVWDDHLVLYEWKPEAGSLVRMEWKDGVEVDRPGALPLASIRACFAHPSRSVRQLSQGILRELRFSGTAQPLQLHLVTEVEVGGGRPPERFSRDLSLYLRNGTR